MRRRQGRSCKIATSGCAADIQILQSRFHTAFTLFCRGLDISTGTDIAEICQNPYITPLRYLFVFVMYPGYSGIVQYGHGSFLITALGFALLIDLFLITDFYWSALLSSGQRNMCLIALCATWLVLTAIASYWKHQIASAHRTENNDETFRQTINHYLGGDWFAAESQMLPYLKKYPKDIEMLLLQATMYRHAERYEEALLILEKLLLLHDSRFWCAEIEHERTLSRHCL